MRRVTAILIIVALLAFPATVLAQEQFKATLTADAEVPPATVPDDYAGTGDATVTISDDGTEIQVELTFEGLTGDPVGAHIHWGTPDEAGPVILPLDHTAGSPISQTLTEADFSPAEGGPQTFEEALDAMREGNTYINVHTEQNQPGEIRGQIVPVPDTATEDAPASPASTATIMLLVLAAAAAFVVGVRRFALRRA